jgi:hypothetical protein
MAKPFSSRVKLVIEYDENSKKYKISDKDIEVLQNYEISIDEINRTTN